jgi:hypothetical protein
MIGLEVVLTGWQLLAGVVSVALITFGSVSWWDGNRGIERDQDRINAARLARIRRENALRGPLSRVERRTDAWPPPGERDQ